VPFRQPPADRITALAGSGVQHQRAAAVDEQHRRAAIEARRAFRAGAIRNCWRSELGAQSGRRNQPACFLCLFVYAFSLSVFYLFVLVLYTG